MRILVAEDDLPLRGVLARGLAEQGYVVDEVGQGDDALHMLRLYDYGAAILDWRMPGMTGYDVAREARRLHISTPILMLTARDTVADRISGLDAGADDYLVKPFDFGELLARLRALQRRPAETDPPTIERAGLRLDPATREVMIHGEPLRLTPIEFSTLELLLRRAPAQVPREIIANHVWEDETVAIGSNTINVHMANLRRKLAGSGLQLVSVRGSGYRLIEE